MIWPAIIYLAGAVLGFAYVLVPAYYRALLRCEKRPGYAAFESAFGGQDGSVLWLFILLWPVSLPLVVVGVAAYLVVYSVLYSVLWLLGWPVRILARRRLDKT